MTSVLSKLKKAALEAAGEDDAAELQPVLDLLSQTTGITLDANKPWESLVDGLGPKLKNAIGDNRIVSEAMKDAKDAAKSLDQAAAAPAAAVKKGSTAPTPAVTISEAQRAATPAAPWGPTKVSVHFVLEGKVQGTKQITAKSNDTAARLKWWAAAHFVYATKQRNTVKCGQPMVFRIHSDSQGAALAGVTTNNVIILGKHTLAELGCDSKTAYAISAGAVRAAELIDSDILPWAGFVLYALIAGHGHSKKDLLAYMEASFRVPFDDVLVDQVLVKFHQAEVITSKSCPTELTARVKLALGISAPASVAAVAQGAATPPAAAPAAASGAAK